jgi:hypothetical protein
MITDGHQGHDTVEPPWIKVHKDVIRLAGAPASAGDTLSGNPPAGIQSRIAFPGSTGFLTHIIQQK